MYGSAAGPDKLIDDALTRAEAVTGLALLRTPVADVLDQAAQLLTRAIRGSTAAIYLVDGSVATLAASAGGDPLTSRPVPGAVAAARDHTGVVLTVPSAAGLPLAVLDVRAPDLVAADHAFVAQIGEVVEAAVVRHDRMQELLRSEARLVEAQRISHVGSYDFELATNTNIWSDQLYRIYGREPQSFEATYEVFLSMLHPDDREHVMAVHQHSMATLEPFEMEERVVWPDGQVRTLASWGEVVAVDGVAARMVGICWDITDRRAMEEQLVRDALHDRLTGLPNRALLLDRLSHAVGGLTRHGRTLAVLFIDIDRFKVINDSLGHEAGDEVLVEMAARLERTMRPGDTVGRFGGDEFVVLCEDLDHPE